MILFPAIDLKSGKVVRLYQGKFTDVTEYGQDPVAVALQWEKMGAQWLHVVDLDGAQSGIMKNEAVVGSIAKAVKIPIQVGGGIRGEASIDYLISVAGVSRVVLGTKAIEDQDFISKVIRKWKDRIVVSLDCSNGKVSLHGWEKPTNIMAVDMALKLQDMGLSWLVYTDIAKDGTLAGPNYSELQNMLNSIKKVGLIASGGIATIDDIKKLCLMKGLAGAITGKAIYEGKLDLKQALEICSTNV